MSLESGDAVSFALCGCSLPTLSRRNRVGLVDLVYACFGRYPWSCRSCGTRSYRRQRGKRRMAEVHPISVERARRRTRRSTDPT